MEILVLLVPLSVLVALGIAALFWWSVRSGQFDDLDGPAHRVLDDDDAGRQEEGAPDEQNPRPDVLTSVKPDRGAPR